MQPVDCGIVAVASILSADKLLELFKECIIKASHLKNGFSKYLRELRQISNPD